MYLVITHDLAKATQAAILADAERARLSRVSRLYKRTNPAPWHTLQRPRLRLRPNARRVAV